MAEKAQVTRPDPRDNSESRQGTKLGPQDVNPEIVKTRVAEKFMDRSGSLAISSKLQIAHISVLRSLRKTGFACDAVIQVYEDYEKRSPNLAGIGRTQAIQILTAPQVVIPGVGRMEDAYLEKPGVVSRLVGWLTGSGNNQQQVKQ